MMRYALDIEVDDSRFNKNNNFLRQELAYNFNARVAMLI